MFTEKTIQFLQRRILALESALRALPGVAVKIYDGDSNQPIFVSSSGFPCVDDRKPENVVTDYDSDWDYSDELNIEKINLGNNLHMWVKYDDVAVAYDEDPDAVFDNIDLITWTAYPDGTIKRYNKSWYDYNGFTRESVLKDGGMNFVHPDDRDTQLQGWLKAVSTGAGSFEGDEFRGLSASGEYKWFLSRAFPRRNARGDIVKWVGTATDIDDLKKAKNEVILERKMLKTVLDRLPIAVVASSAPSAESPKGEIFLMNKKYFEIWHLGEADLKVLSEAMDWKGFHSDGSPVALREWPFARAMLNGETVTDEVIQCVVGDKSLRHISFCATPFYDSIGQVAGAIGTGDDVTEYREQQQERVALLAREQAAIESSRMKSAFLASISHELRTPLVCLIFMKLTHFNRTALSEWPSYWEILI